MSSRVSKSSAEAFQEAFRVRPEVAEETAPHNGLGVYGWKTPPMEGFELPQSDELVLALHLGGSQRVRAVTDQGLSRSVSRTGLVTLLPPGRRSAFRTDGSVSLVSLHIPQHLIASPDAPAYLTRLTQAEVSRFAFRDTFVSAGMTALLQAARSGRPTHPDYYGKVVDALLCHLAQWTGTPDPAATDPAATDNRLGRVTLAALLKHIDQSLGSKLSLDELAGVSGLSRTAFTRGFRAALGLSPHQYLSLRRVETAKRLLRDTDLDLAFIAQETGFASQSHFTAVFRDFAGCTPARFRESD